MPDQVQSDPAERGEVAPHRLIAALAARQHGVVTRRQLLQAGVSSSAIERRVASRQLLALHRGVYAVGHARLRREGFWHAAVLAAGPGAVLSHREAAALHGLRPADRTTVDVTVAARRRVTGVQVHRARLDADDVVTLGGLPVTAVARTLVDLAGVVPPRALRTALEEAERSRRLDMDAIEAALARTRQRRGSGHRAIRAELAALRTTSATFTRSALEERFLSLVARHGLPRPRTNASVDGVEVDALWTAERLVVELDGYAFHRTRHAFERDRARDAELTAGGYRVLRFTHAQVAGRPAWTAARVAAALQAATG